MSYESFLSVSAKKQGQLKGSSPKKGRDKFIPVISFKMGASAPYDANSGGPNGHRQHKEVVVTIEASAASPQFLQALWTNEVLDKVIIEHVSRTADGAKEQVVERITLVDAIISNIDRFNSDHAKAVVKTDVNNLEEISFIFRQITVENPVASTSATDDWNVAGS